LATMTLEKPYPAVVTGGGRGLGRAISLALAELGCPVAVNYVSDEDAAKRTCEAIAAQGGRAIPVQADVSRPHDAARLVEAARSAFGPIGIAVNNAGIAIQRDVFAASIEDFDTTFAVNVRSAFLVSQAVIGDMRELGFGRLVFLSSNAARTGGSMSAPYASSKAALEGMMHHYAQRLMPWTITANAISPSYIATEIFDDKVMPPSDKLPMGRMGKPEEVAMALQMIVCCGYMTGQTIQVSAGRYMT